MEKLYENGQKTSVNFRKDGKYTAEEKSDMLDELDFNEVFVRFAFFQEYGQKKYIYATEGEDGKVLLRESCIMSQTSSWRDESQILFVAEGDSGNILTETFAYEGDSRQNADGEWEYRIDHDIWGTREEAMERAVDDGDYLDWKEEMKSKFEQEE